MKIQFDHPYTAEEIASITGGKTAARSVIVSALTTNSHEAAPGDLFIALRGEKDDGHRYLKQGIENGASLLLAEEGAPPEMAVLVKDCWKALGDLASAAKQRIAPTTIAITGSAGKTSTKSMIGAVLAKGYRTHITKENQNNFLGLCLSLLSMPQDTKMLVLELGMNHAGEIKALSHLARPDIAVITNIGHAHIGNLGSRAAIAAAKAEIFFGCTTNARCLIPDHEPLLDDLIPPDLSIIHCGHSKESDCYYEDLRMGSNTTVANYTYQGNPMGEILIPGIGAHLADCATFAVALGHELGISNREIRVALSQVQMPPMRQQILHWNGITIIADCYNASPESSIAASYTLKAISNEQGGKSLALLGDMRELGELSRPLHEAVGESYAIRGIDYLFTFGAAALHIADGARHAGMPESHILCNPDPANPTASVKQIKSVLARGDALLIKAARSMTAERILNILLQQEE